MKGKLLTRDAELEVKFRLFLGRTVRHASERAWSKHVRRSKLGSTKLLLLNSTWDGSLETATLLSMLSAPPPLSTLQANVSAELAPANYLQSHSLTSFSRHSSLVAVLVIMSLFLIITISTTGLMLAFCKKKNTVFALQKCEQDSEYELDDMEQTDIETCDEDISPCTSKVRSRTWPSFSNVTDSDLSGESPSRQPLVSHGSARDEVDATARNGMPRSFTINFLQNISKDTNHLENIDNAIHAADAGFLPSTGVLPADVSVLVDVCAPHSVRSTGLDPQETGPHHTHCQDPNLPSSEGTLLD